MTRPLRSRDFHVYICDAAHAGLPDEAWLESVISKAMAERGIDIVSLHVRQLQPGDSIRIEPDADIGSPVDVGP